jgi:hypothetical protein
VDNAVRGTATITHVAAAVRRWLNDATAVNNL